MLHIVFCRDSWNHTTYVVEYNETYIHTCVVYPEGDLVRHVHICADSNHIVRKMWWYSVGNETTRSDIEKSRYYRLIALWSPPLNTTTSEEESSLV